MTNQKSKIGLIGVGMMGHGIGLNIIKHGYPLVFLDHPGNQPAEDLLSAAAVKVGSAAAVARDADVVILCLTGTPQVEDVLYGKEGLLKCIRPGLVVIDCSTAIPSSTVKIAQAIEAAGGLFLDAPMTRTPKEAAQGRLNLIVGGDRGLFERCRPILECFAENIAFAGPVGSGHQMKLIHNFVSLGFSAVLCEAAACAQRAGIEPEVLIDILAKGGGGGIVLDRLQPYIQSGDSSGFRFSMANALKDMGYYVAMAKESEAMHTTAEAVLRTYEYGVRAGAEQAAVPELITILAGSPGLEQ